MGHNIFQSVFNSGSGLGDITVSVDPFSGVGCLHVPPVVRYPGGPVVTRQSFIISVQQQKLANETSQPVPEVMRNLEDTFNCGVAHFADQYIMLVRFQNAARFNHVYRAFSTDGIHWSHEAELIRLHGLPAKPDAAGIRASGYSIPDDKPWHGGVIYDPRITHVEGDSYYVAFAVDYDTIEPPGHAYLNICDNVLFRTSDFRDFHFVCTLAGHTRNCVLFPRKIGDYYYAAGRPNTSKRVNTVLFRSPDLQKWEEAGDLFTGGHAWMIFAGPGFPPFETEDYWVMGVHGVETHGTFQVVYRAGVCLLDKKTMQVAHGPVPILHPGQPYEMNGTVSNVIFPTGLLFSDGKSNGIKSRDVRLAIYYGAADSSVGVGLTTVGRLIDTALGKYDPFNP